MTHVAIIPEVDDSDNLTGSAFVLEKAGSVYFVTFYDGTTGTFFTGTDSSGTALATDATAELDDLIAIQGGVGSLNELLAFTGAAAPQGGLPPALQPQLAQAPLPGGPPAPPPPPAGQPQPVVLVPQLQLTPINVLIPGDGGLIPPRIVQVMGYRMVWVPSVAPPQVAGPIVPTGPLPPAPPRIVPVQPNGLYTPPIDFRTLPPATRPLPINPPPAQPRPLPPTLPGG